MIYLIAAVVMAAPADELSAMMEFWSAANEPYKRTLQATSLKHPMDSARFLMHFRNAWDEFRLRYDLHPPAPFGKDPDWLDDLKAVSGWIAEADREIRGRRLEDAHETLENVRLRWLTVRTRSKVDVFGDQLTRFHEPMEKTALLVKGKTAERLSERDLRDIREVIPELGRLLKPILEASDSGIAPEPAAERRRLIDRLAESVKGIADAADRNDRAALIQAGGKLKPAFAELYMRFG